jgi:hypothetical protein
MGVPSASWVSVIEYASEDLRGVSDLDKTENDERGGGHPQEKSPAPRLARAAKHEQRADHACASQIYGDAAAMSKAALHAHLKQRRNAKSNEKSAE